MPLIDSWKGRCSWKDFLAYNLSDFLNYLEEAFGRTDMDWLLDVPPHQAKEFLMSIYGLGVKTVECILLLTLLQKSFHIHMNAGRVFSRLGWVPLRQLQEGEEFHEIKEYELHCQIITFGKVFCTERNPSCGECPMKDKWKYFNSLRARQLESKDVDDLCPYLFAESVERDESMHEEDAVYWTILILVKTATREIFPLNGTFFQANEVVADDESSEVLIKVPRASLNESSNHGSVLWKQHDKL
ncbi:hypothetical protein OROMI_011269 [Orobanche minor]